MRCLSAMLLLAAVLAGCDNGGHVGRYGDDDAAYYRNSTENLALPYGQTAK